MKVYLARALLGCFAVAAMTSCSGQSYQIAEVDGVVLLKNKPLKKVFIQFLPIPELKTEGPTSSAETDDNGRFRLRYLDPKRKVEVDGAVVGTHRVVVVDMDRPEAAQGVAPKRGRFSEAYGDLTKSPLRQEVKPGPQTIEIKVD